MTQTLTQATGLDLTTNHVEQTLDDKAKTIMRGNDHNGHTVPTEGLYPYQWNWDSAFAALGFAQFDIDRGWRELETLFDGQWGTGMVPHILFRSDDPSYFPGSSVWNTFNAKGKANDMPSSGISQPPVAASMAWQIYQGNPEAGQARLKALFPKLMAYHRWFMDKRAESGAIATTHPWETGRDNAPDWDGAMASFSPTDVQPYTRRDTTHVDPSMRPTQADYDRYIYLVEFGVKCDWDEGYIAEHSPFRVADPTLTFTLLRGHRDLLKIAEQFGESQTVCEEIEQWISRLESGVQTLWNAETQSYDAKDLRSGKFAGSISNASFLSWYAGLADDRQLPTLQRVLSKVKYGVPSCDPEQQRFDHVRYWRGPVWAVMNYMIGNGLAEAGHQAEAEQVRKATRDLIADHGFAEYFSPVDGTPAGGGTFTWTAAIWLAWASPSVDK